MPFLERLLPDKVFNIQLQVNIMQLSKWSHEIVSLTLVAAVFVIAFSNSVLFTGMIVSERNESMQPELMPLGEGCEYVDVPYTENVCTDEKYNYTITQERFINSRYGYEHVCIGAVFLKNDDMGAGTWTIGYIFEINNETFRADSVSNYIMPGKETPFVFEHLCEENTTFGGTYFIESEPAKTMCGPATMFKKEVKCGITEVAG
jgi:hypothetical protein